MATIKYTVFTVIFIFCIPVSGQWQLTNGPYGARISTGFSHQTNNFIGTWSGSVYRSSDNGESWVYASNGLPKETIKSFAVNDSTVFVGMALSGIFKSKDNGESWTEANNGLTNFAIQTVFIQDTSIFVGTAAGVFYSRNNGNSWELRNSGLQTNVITTFLPFGNLIYAGSSTAGVYFSDDLGMNWQPTGTSGLTNLRIVDLASSGAFIFAGTFGGVFISGDNGNTWTDRSVGLVGQSVFSMVFIGAEWFVLTQGGINASSNNGQSWQVRDDGIEYTFPTVLWESSNLFVGTLRGGVYRSSNGGVTWIESNSGILETTCISLLSTAGILAACTDNGAFVFNNVENSWTKYRNGIMDYSTNAILLNSGAYFLGTTGGGSITSGVYRSLDSGQAWTNVLAAGAGAGIIVRSLVAANTIIFAGTYQGVYVTDNNGDSWVAKNSGINDVRIQSLMVVGQDIWAGNENGEVYISANNGESWELRSTGLPGAKISDLHSTASALYAATLGAGVYSSTDNGISWQALNNGLPTTQISAILGSPSSLFAGTIGEGIYVFDSELGHWAEFNTGLLSFDVHSLETDGQNIYGGSAQGVYLRPFSDLQPPSAPVNLIATAVSTSSITLSWASTTENTRYYKIYRSLSSGGSEIAIDSVDHPLTNYQDSGLEVQSIYYYRVVAVNQFGESDFSNETNATTFGVAPSSPSGLVAQASFSDINLSWNPNTAETIGYSVFRSTDSVAVYSKIDSVLHPTVNYVDSGLPLSTKYFYQVSAYNEWGVSTPSAVVSATTGDDTTPPVIDSLIFNEILDTGNEFSVDGYIADKSGIKSTGIEFRQSGDRDYSAPIAGIASLSNRYAFAIPSTLLQDFQRGLQFRIIAEDSSGNSVRTAMQVVKINLPEGITNPSAQPDGSSIRAYRLFSVPLALDDSSPETFLTVNTSLPKYNKAQFRWFGTVGNTLSEYPAINPIVPGAGYFFITTLKSINFSSGAGKTINSGQPFVISLLPGWNTIGNPFNFNIPLDSISVSVGNLDIRSYEGEWEQNLSGLEPWKAYAVYVSGDQGASLTIKPGVAELNVPRPIYSTISGNKNNWQLQIIAETAGSIDRFNFIGQHQSAKNEFDDLDLPEAPRIPGQVALVFEDAENGVDRTIDLRSPAKDGHQWEFHCLVDPEDPVIKMQILGVENLPNAYKCYLLDDLTANSHYLDSDEPLTFANHGQTERRFKLLVGNSSFLSTIHPGLSEAPTHFQLFQNYPNPFNPITTIRYKIPVAGHVTLEIYNVLGQKSAELVNEYQNAGVYQKIWNADAAAVNQSSTGVYFVRLNVIPEEGTNYSGLIKLMLLK